MSGRYAVESVLLYCIPCIVIYQDYINMQPREENEIRQKKSNVLKIHQNHNFFSRGNDWQKQNTQDTKTNVNQ